jgi:molecular chaperone GrpE (heat shock protein)
LNQFMAAPAGNQNAARAKVWRAAIERALERRNQSRTDGIKEIDALADQLLTLVSKGDITAIKEFGDRLDGKPAQAIIGGDESDAPLRVVLANQDASL